MKTKTYILRPVTDLRDIVLYYEFVRKEDDAILRSSKDYERYMDACEEREDAKREK